MTEYQTDTGCYVLVDTEGVILAKADVPIGTHPVADNVDVSASFDVDVSDDLSDYVVGETVQS